MSNSWVRTDSFFYRLAVNLVVYVLLVNVALFTLPLLKGAAMSSSGSIHLIAALLTLAVGLQFVKGKAWASKSLAVIFVGIFAFELFDLTRNEIGPVSGVGWMYLFALAIYLLSLAVVSVYLLVYDKQPKRTE